MRTSQYSWPFPIHIEEHELTPKHEAQTIVLHGRQVPKLVNNDSVERIAAHYREYWSKQASESYKKIHSN